MNAKIGNAAPADDAIVVVIAHDVTVTMTEKLLHVVTRGATRVGEEAGAVMMIADTHVVTEEVMEIITVAAAAVETALAHGRLVDITVRATIAGIVNVTIAATEVGMMTDTEVDVHQSVIPHPS